MSRQRRPRTDPRVSDVQRLVTSFLRLPPKVQLVIGILILVALAIAGFVYLQQPESQPMSLPPAPSPSTQPAARPPRSPRVHHEDVLVDPAVSPHMTLGNPSKATIDVNNPDNYLIVRKAYGLSYNNTKGTPNWVSWRIVRSDVGTFPRDKDFPVDPALPAGFKRATRYDYNSSGFDRGHMCPKGDRDGDEAMSNSTFYMTNIIPQAANVNQKAWNFLEDYCRDLVAKQNKRLYVVSGPMGKGGTGLKGYVETLANGKITVPAECWKVIVVMNDTGKPLDDPSDIPASARVIAVVMPNDQNKVGEDWAGFRTSPAEIEQKTGYRFFDRLRPEVADVLRNKVDRETIPPVSPYRYQKNGSQN